MIIFGCNMFLKLEFLHFRRATFVRRSQIFCNSTEKVRRIKSELILVLCFYSLVGLFACDTYLAFEKKTTHFFQSLSEDFWQKNKSTIRCRLCNIVLSDPCKTLTARRPCKYVIRRYNSDVTRSNILIIYSSN